MKFNSFNSISPAIEDSKKLLKPKGFREWLKLGFVAMLSGNGSGGGSGGGGRGLNISLPSGSNGSEESVGESLNSITGNAVDSVKAKVGGLAYVIAPIIFVVFLLFVVMSYIKSVFTFMFIECIDTKKTEIKNYWHSNQSVGMSLFLFKILITVSVLLVIGLFSLPFVIPLASMGADAYFDSLSWAMLLWVLPLFFLLIIFFIIFGVFMSLVFNFAIPHMYFHRAPIKPSIKKVFGKIWQKKVETLVYILSKMVLAIVIGIATVLIAVVLLIPFLIIAVPFALIFWGLFVVYGLAWFVIASLVVVGLTYLVFFVYVFSVIFLPFSTFSWYFTIRNYKLLMK